jgi:hypothetical protein
MAHLDDADIVQRQLSGHRTCHVQRVRIFGSVVAKVVFCEI